MSDLHIKFFPGQLHGILNLYGRKELPALPFLELVPQIVQEVRAAPDGNAGQCVEDVLYPHGIVSLHHIGQHIDLARHGQQNAHTHGNVLAHRKLSFALRPDGLDRVDNRLDEQGNQDHVGNFKKHGIPS